MLDQDVNKPLNGKQVVIALVVLFAAGAVFQNLNVLTLIHPWIGILILAAICGVWWVLRRKKTQSVNSKSSE